MNSLTKPLPEDLLLVRNNIQQHFSTDPSSIRSYIGDIRDLTEKYKNSSDKEILESLVQCWIPQIHFFVFGSKNPKFLLSDMHLFIEFVTNTEMTRTAVAGYENEKIMSGLCMNLVELARRGRYPAVTKKVDILLQQWTLKPIKDDTLSSMQGIIDYLYGPAIWAIYREESNRDAHFMQYVLNQDFPLPLSSNTDAIKYEAFSLSNNIT